MIDALDEEEKLDVRCNTVGLDNSLSGGKKFHSTDSSVCKEDHCYSQNPNASKNIDTTESNQITSAISSQSGIPNEICDSIAKRVIKDENNFDERLGTFGFRIKPKGVEFNSNLDAKLLSNSEVSNASSKQEHEHLLQTYKAQDDKVLNERQIYIAERIASATVTAAAAAERHRRLNPMIFA